MGQRTMKPDQKAYPDLRLRSVHQFQDTLLLNTDSSPKLIAQVLLKITLRAYELQIRSIPAMKKIR